MSVKTDGLILSHVEKSFGATRAVVDASLHIKPGEVLSLLGENGSGKSTLVKILGGVHQPDGGAITLDGQDYKPKNPRTATNLGVATVFQEVLTVGGQSVLDNIWLGSDGDFRPTHSKKYRVDVATEVVGKLLDGISLDTPASALSLSDRQAICIARALVRKPRVLILDESTAALDVKTRDRLFDEIRQLKSSGMAILFISHRMDEVATISDRVAILRSGLSISEFSRENMSMNKLIADMTGEAEGGQRHVHDRDLGEVVLAAEGVQLAQGSKPITLELRAGELVGLAGLEGQGQDEFIKALAGIHKVAGSISVKNSTPKAANSGKRGSPVAYLPKERRGESLFEPMTILENFALPSLNEDRTAGFINSKKMASRFQVFVDSLRIKFNQSSDAISTLSGGNQQKILFARWIATAPRVLLLNDPTRGVDISTKREIYSLLEKLCSEGMSVVILSSEVEELVEVVDRVLVFRDQSVFRELSGEDITIQTIVAGYFGQLLESER